MTNVGVAYYINLVAKCKGKIAVISKKISDIVKL